MRYLKYYTFVLFVFLCTSLFSETFLRKIEPKNNAVIGTDNILFRWNKTFITGSYEVQVATDAAFTIIVLDTITIKDNLTTSLSSSGGTYYWRVRLKGVGYVSNWTPAESFTTVNPKTLGSLLVWYDSQALTSGVGTPVSNWQDKSGNTNNAVQADVAKQPAVASGGIFLNNKKVARFDGVNDFLEFNSLNNIRSAFFVYKFITDLSFAPPLLGDPSTYDFHGGETSLLLSPFANDNVKFGQGFVNKTSKLPYDITKNFDYNLLSLVTTNNANAKYITNDRNLPGRGLLNGDYAEVLLYSDTLNPAVRNKLEDYIRTKYAPPVAMRDSITGGNFCDQVTIRAPNNYVSVQWFNGSITSTVQVAANGNYSITTKDIFGFFSTEKFLVYPYAKFSDATIYMCEGQTLNVNLPLPNTYSVLWSTGSTNKNISITTAGKYTVSITDGLGCVFNDTLRVETDNPKLSMTPRTLDTIYACLNEKLYVQSITSFDSIRWSNGSTEEFIVLTNNGNYSVYASNSAGCVLNKSFYIKIVGQAPTADFFISSARCQNVPISFINNSTFPAGNTITNYQWNFSNGFSSSSPTPNIAFSNLGTASASLKITTNVGCTDSIFKTFINNKKPKAGFYNLLSCSGNPTTLVDSSRTGNALINSWTWNFGSLGSSILQNPTFYFPDQGSYPVLLKVTDTNNCADTLTQYIEVNPSPIADFSFDAACGTTPVNFKYLATVQPPFTIDYKDWDFGDGFKGGNLFDVQHSYAGPGVYNVQLAVRATPKGCVDTVVKQIRVFDFPIVDFTVSNTQCVNKEVLFTDISVTPDGTPVDGWKWYFSGQSTDTIQNPRYSFNTEGNYTIQLTAKNAAGCSGTKLRSIAITQAPVPKFTFNPQNGLPPLNVTYTNQSSTSGNYIWNYGDGSPSVSGYNPPQHIYNAIGTYPITLISTDFRGCTDTARKFILVDRAFLDGAMASIIITPNGNFYKITANIVNNSNVEITSLGLSLQLGGGSVIRENWTGSLLPGQSTTYEFIGEIKLSDNNQIPVICANIDNVNNFSPETRTDNNSTCKEVKVGQFDVLNLYPNPAFETLNFGVMLPSDGKVTIGFITALGQLEYQLSFDGLKGYNNFTTSTMPLNAAIYVAEVVYDGQVIRRKFMRQDRK
jgi:PKD repeat protein